MGRKRQRPQEDSGLSIEELFEWNKALAKNSLNVSAFNVGNMSRNEMIARGLYQEETLMARIKHQVEVSNDSLKVPEWTTSAPRRPGKYVIDAKSEGARFSVIFAAPFAGKKFIEATIGDNKPTWVNEKTIKTDEVVIKSDLLEEIMEHDYTGPEEKWTLPPPYANYARQLQGGRYVEQLEEKPAQKAPGGTKEAKKPAERTTRPVRTSNASRANLVTAIDIAGEFKLLPRELRAVLRKLKLEKPEAGWAWPKDEADKIRKQITKELG